MESKKEKQIGLTQSRGAAEKPQRLLCGSAALREISFAVAVQAPTARTPSRLMRFWSSTKMKTGRYVSISASSYWP